MTHRLDDKVALVTGAGSGIGREAAIVLAREGARVVVTDLDADSAEDAAEVIRKAGGEAIAVAADVSQPDQIRNMVQVAVETYGRLDIAFNNAGIGGPANLTGDYSLDSWNKVLAVNLTGVFLCMQAQLEVMLAQGSGSIVNCSSMLGTVGYRHASAYVAAKHGVIGLTKAAALEYAQHGIRVNALCPGFVDTPILDQETAEASKAAREALVKSTPIGRLGTPAEIADAVLWLASDASSFMTGQSLVVDGGYVVQ